MDEQHSTIRLTAQRRAILEELRNVKTHPTADEVYEMVRRRLPRISLGTVYRNLDWLAARGLVQRLAVAGRQMRFDADLEPHEHIRCVRCGRLGDLPASPVCDLATCYRKATDFEIIGHRLELLGYCPACRGRSSVGGSGGETSHADETDVLHQRPGAGGVV